VGIFAKIARVLFGPIDAAPIPTATSYSDPDFERINHSGYYGRVRPHRQSHFVPDTLAPLLDYLHQAHGLNIDAIYLENYKSPVATIVMDGALPMDELILRFPPGEDLKYGAGEFWSLSAFTSVQGKPAV